MYHLSSKSTEAVLTCTHDLYITIFHLKIIIFTAMKYCSILHRHVFVMASSPDPDRTAP